MGLRASLMGLAIIWLSGCQGMMPFGDPMANVDLLSDVEVAAPTAANLVASPEPGGFFAQLFAPDADEAPAATPAAFATSEEPAADIETAPRLGGLFGSLGAGSRPSTPRPDDVLPGARLEFGKIGVTCGISGKDLGLEIENVAGFRIFDTAPNTTAPRPHYITGFDDRCARQFTAALVLTGDVGTHELVRYSQTRVALDYSVTDNAYEAIKASFCRVAHGKPCGARLDRLSSKATFVTAYRSFGASPVWAEILLYDGKVAASGLEGL